MSQKQPLTGDAAWRQHRDAISKRNDETFKRAVAEQRSRDSAQAARGRADAKREADQLRTLNQRIAERRTSGSR